jgi:3-oxoacyl-[acyl-carrier-protein] synthase-3
MASLSVGGIAIKGISCSVPAQIERNIDITNQPIEDIQKFINSTGIEERRIASEDVCTSDLCIKAAEDLVESLGWEKDSVDILIFVSQTPDYVIPVTSAILQDRLQLSKNCIAFDVPLGCSGYVYGMSIITGMMKAFGLKRGIFLAGDTCSKFISKDDKSTFPLFGDAGSATAFELDDSASRIYFDMGTDGSGYEAIIIPSGGCRSPMSAKVLEQVEQEPGISRNQFQLHLNGMDVFSFGISQAPKTVNNLLNTFSLQKDDVDYFVFHQANMLMNTKIARKLSLPESKTPYSLKNFGNTSSATIPLTIVTELQEQLKQKDANFVVCGFGVGLSWGTAHLNLKKETKLIFSNYE